VAFCSAIPSIPMSMGVPRVLPGIAVTHLLGNPTLPASDERELRERLTARALGMLTTEVTKPTLFSAA
jgi:glycine/betaine/sarcosine/D-proline reductase family selenoprotein B